MSADRFLAVEGILASKGVSVARLCRRAEVAESTWHRLREGKSGTIRAGTLARLSEAFTHLVGEPWPAEPETKDAA